MTLVYVAHGAENRLSTACQTVLKQFNAGQAILIYCTDEKRLHKFSEMLWGIEAAAFVPHPYVGEAAPAALVRLTRQNPAVALQREGEFLNPPILLNLDVDCPPDYQQFSQLLEIVSNHPEDQRLARARMKLYKDAGMVIKYHQITAS